MSSNYFEGTKQDPYHISIGAVVRDSEGKICCHYFSHASHPAFGSFENLYLLMRETIEPNESIEQCLHRGLQEEFGMKAELISHLGSIVSHFPKGDVVVEKTTLYFLCEYISHDRANRKVDDPEASSVITWLTPSELILIMRDQGKRFGREDLDESIVIERLIGLA